MQCCRFKRNPNSHVGGSWRIHPLSVDFENTKLGTMLLQYPQFAVKSARHDPLDRVRRPNIRWFGFQLVREGKIVLQRFMNQIAQIYPHSSPQPFRFHRIDLLTKDDLSGKILVD